MKKITADQLIEQFYKYVDQSPNRLQKFLSYGHGRKIQKAVRGVEWDKVKGKKNSIDRWLKMHGSDRPGKVLAKRTIALAWAWLARSYEYAVIQRVIPRNPFNRLIPRARIGCDIH